MFHRGLRKLRRDERGQALVVGAIAMLVVALVVLSSVSIGHGIYSKIKLQDAADAQSYSIAVKEARAYNFLAYTNRAMVVHYNAMLTMMAYVSHAFYLKETVGRIAGWLSYIPYIGPIFRAIEKIIDAWMQIVDGLSQALVPLLTALNVGLWLAQEAVVYATAMDLLTSASSDPVRLTDPKAQPGYSMSLGSVGGITGFISTIGLNANNVANFLHPIDDGMHGNSFSGVTDPVGTGTRSKLLGANNLSDHKMAKYRLLMGNIVNSARREWTAVGSKPFLIGRRWNIGLGCLLDFDKRAEGEIKSFSERHKNNLKDQLFAEDSVGLEIGGCFGDPLFEFRYKLQAKADFQNGGHSWALYVKPPKVDKQVANEKPHHKFFGITPFFTSDPSFFKPYSFHFGYPCNLVITTKNMINKPEIFQLQSEVLKESGSADVEKTGMLDMTWKFVGGEPDDADLTAKIMPLFRDRTGGMMAAAVGRAIYHRPGEWKEEPNFFNPLWTARLAPLRTHWQSPQDSAAYPELIIANLAQDGINY
jgi:hypothetical protein